MFVLEKRVAIFMKFTRLNYCDFILLIIIRFITVLGSSLLKLCFLVVSIKSSLLKLYVIPYSVKRCSSHFFQLSSSVVVVLLVVDTSSSSQVFNTRQA